MWGGMLWGDMWREREDSKQHIIYYIDVKIDKYIDTLDIWYCMIYIWIILYDRYMYGTVLLYCPSEIMGLSVVITMIRGLATDSLHVIGHIYTILYNIYIGV